MPDDLRNVAIIAHVDHGKTSLVDELLRQSGMFRDEELDKLAGGQHNLVLDSNDIERERGITILSKNCAVTYTREDGSRTRINIVDTPGHADFGGEVERVLRMADGCLLLVDAFEGPMPQTRFVLDKALASGLKPVVVINKCDRDTARPDDVASEVFDLLVELGAEDDVLDFPIVYASAKEGWATADLHERRSDMRAVFEAILEHVPPAGGDVDGALQMLVTTLDANSYVGRIGIGRVMRGSIRRGQRVTIARPDRTKGDSTVVGLQGFSGLGRHDREEVSAGDLCAVHGVEGLDIGDTLCDVERVEALASVEVDEPTITMIFRVNDSPFAGTEGRFVTSRQIRGRLEKELEHNVALRVEDAESAESFRVSGRGLLHLGVLLETMRREGFELAVGKPEVILREIDATECEPIEEAVVDCPEAHVGAVMELIGSRRGEMTHMDQRGTMSRLTFRISSRGLIGLRSRMLTATQGEATMHTRVLEYVPVVSEARRRPQGVLIATERGRVTSYAVDQFADRGVLFVEPGDQVYAGQIVGEHNRDNDLPVNIVREKKLTNIRSSTKEAFVTLKAPRRLSLEGALEYIESDELVELTPESLRLRKRLLDENARKRASREAASSGV
ncbi:MAG: translational GTPase TypA [Phycisphaerales bacterium JB043]